MVVVNNPNATGRIVLSIGTKAGKESGFPKQVCLLDAKFKVLDSAWTVEERYEFNGLLGGLYVIRVTSSFGEYSSDIIELMSGGNVEAMVMVASPQKKKLGMLRREKLSGSNRLGAASLEIIRDERIFESTMEVGEAVANDETDPSQLSKFITPNDYESAVASENAIRGNGNVVSSEYFQLELWIYTSSLWKKKSARRINLDQLRIKTRIISYRARDGMGMLVAVSERFNRKVVVCPNNTSFEVLLGWESNEDADIHPLSITLSIGNDKADTLLTMINNGAFRDASSFADSALAERMLLGKLDDPIAAAIGGYYLILANDFVRLHDWANNLANWFPWLPDGPIIHAWQMIAIGIPGEKEVSVRSRLLEAFDRGVPLVTEGLRLLFDGLSQLATISQQKDTEVVQVLERLRPYVRCADWAQKLTTLNGMELSKDRKWPIIDTTIKLLKSP